MFSSRRFIRSLRLAALVILLAGVATWFATGRHVGWTQTSRVTLRQDEVTGIEYPLREDTFVAGLEIPAGAAVAALVLAGASLLLRRRPTHA
ncbi:hypothetical protein [Opitutus sp. ER46]|uniref:hypothetical protein n=1 Tax=Opitutus sp. ER46 TaxID=2161864 RepID=UPI000D2FC3B3|nr:hypothetical protein [Opitutus sp. ER46]PTX95602.1 hypothetical protein DB354_09300 [Opitutus sp. ER46]